MHADPANQDTTADFERAISQPDERQYVLRLYLTGSTSRSLRSVEVIKALCEQHLKGRYQLEVVDLYQQPGRAQEAQIFAAPTLVKEQPPPLRRLIGDLTNSDRVLIALELKTQKE